MAVPETIRSPPETETTCCVAVTAAIDSKAAAEPTGSMDHSSEEYVKQQLRSCAAGKTMIVITHRTSLLELVDRIIVVDGGKIVADGPKAQVVEALRQGRIGRAA